MSDYPAIVLEFRDQFADEAACRRYLAKLRWPEDFVCQHCRHPVAWLSARGLNHCQQFDHKTSVTSGTLLADTNLSLRPSDSVED